MGCGIAFVLSCGDNLTVKPNADAAIDAARAPDAVPVCDCPAAEPPLAERFVVVSRTRTIAANARSTNAAPCPVGSRPVFGSCTMDLLDPIRNVTLEQAGFFEISPQDWACYFRNNENTPVTLRASVICLKPAS
jgi:hypothetical protein